jgi:hypothetical protein
MILFVFERCGSPCKLGGVERVGLNQANRANKANRANRANRQAARHHNTTVSIKELKTSRS